MIWLFYSVTAAIFVYFLYNHVSRRSWIQNVNRKYILITGCDTGFGNLAAQRFDEIGCHVMAACLLADSCGSLRSSCSSRLLALQMDVTDQRQIDEAFKVVRAHIPEGQGLHCVINNAGLAGPAGPLEWMDIDGAHRLLDINVYGLMRVTNAFLPLLRSNPARSRVINTASVVGRVALPNTGVYSMSKHCVEAYSDQLRRELRPFGISVHTIEPGATLRTRFFESANGYINKVWQGISQHMKDVYGDQYFKKMLFLSLKLIPSLASSTPSTVVEAYVHACLSTRPKTRYSIGWDSVLYLVHSYLPSAIQDWPLSLKLLEPRPTDYTHYMQKTD